MRSAISPYCKVLFACILALNVFVQPANALTLSLDTVTGSSGTQVLVSMRATDFTNLITVQGSLQFNPAVASFLNVEAFGLPGMTQAVNFNVANAATGVISFTWDDGTLAGVTLANGDSLFKVRFNLVGTSGQTTAVTFVNSPTPPLYSDINFDEFTPTTHNGLIQIAQTGCVNGPVDCNDNDPCTVDKCDAGICENAAQDCSDIDLCTTDFCDSVGVCQNVQFNCNDNNACTTDFCSIGECFHNTVTCTQDADLCTIEICNALSGCISTPKDCSDGSLCTNDNCQDGVCSNPAIICNDNDACTANDCAPATGCVFTPIVCNDNDACNGVETCNTLTGCVAGTPLTCNDNNACNGVETCNPLNGCVPGTPLTCNDNNACNGVETCNPLSGCVAGTPLICADADTCTIDNCDPLLGCVHPLNPNCVNPCDTLDCDDNSLCTLDSCDAQSGCFYTSIICNDSNACNGVETCSPLSGCVAGVPLTCNDNNVCNGVETCNPLSGCVAGTPLSCNDNNACNGLETCDALSGCVAGTPLICADSDTCTIDNCDPLLGCVHTLNPNCVNPCDTLDCNDNNLCTLDSCNAQSGCFYTSIICDDGNACNGVETCNSLSGCVVGTPLSCNDNNACNGIETCDALSGCVAGTPLVCNDNNACNGLETCNALSGCVAGTPLTCDDNNVCNGVETCNPISGCVAGTPLTCDDNNICNGVETCTPLNGCIAGTPLVCNDNNACNGLETCDALSGCVAGTTLTCDDNNVCNGLETCNPASGCVAGTPLTCNDNNACNGVENCNPLSGCITGTPLVCNDNNACNGIETCDALLGCVAGTPLTCNDNNACNGLETCNPLLGCVTGTPLTCNDNDPCTTDGCNPATGCTFTSISCDDTDLCTIDKCELGVCVNSPITCNDGSACTDDACSGGICVFTTIRCEDNNLCTLNNCDIFSGCIYPPVTCDDGDLCSVDACAPASGCFYTPVNCEDGEACTFDFCVNGSCNHECDTNAAHQLIWQKALGGRSADGARAVHQTADGGYIVTGYAFSINGNVSGNHGQSDFWVVKLDAAGNLIWQKALGGGKSETANAVKQTADGGYILAGNTKSNDGNVSGNHGGEDFWVVKLDAAGNLTWQKTLGGNNADIANAVAQTSDGGYIVAGYTSSNNGNVSGNHGGSDFWVVKLDAAGNLTWQKALGGTSSDQAHSIQQTTDGGYIVAGNTKSNNGNVSGNHGASDYWVVKLDGAGNISWQKALGGSSSESATSVQQTTDGGFVVAGSSASNNGDVSGNHGNNDFWVVKLNGAGNIFWQKSLGGSSDDFAQSVDQTQDNGYIVAGSSKSNNGNVSGNHGNDDFWTVRLDASGNLLWQKSLGGNKKDYAYSTQQTGDEGFIIAGFTESNNGDVSGNHGSSDFWIVKLAADRICTPTTTLDVALCSGESIVIAGVPVFGAGIYYDTLSAASGCDSILIYNVSIPNCDDSNPCTVDGCQNGICSNIPLICVDGDPCTIDDCGASGCFFTPIVCNDLDLCTNDVCISGTCDFQPIICNDNNPCTDDVCVNGACQFTDERRVYSLTLVNATTDTDIGVLTNGAVIDLAVTGPINVRADVCGTSNIESVKFMLNGIQYRMENIPFYTIGGNNNGNYAAWNVQPGVYTIRAIPYSGNNGAGIIGIAHEVTITIIDGTPPCNNNDRKVLDFMLVSASADADIAPLVNGAVIDLAVTGPINVRANVCFEGNIESVKFLLNGSAFRTESTPVYALAGDNNGDYHTWNVTPGVYTIKATPFSGNNATGTAGTALSVTITIVGSAAKMDGEEQIPSLEEMESVAKLQAYPNPFSDVLNIEFTLAENSKVNLEIFNVAGQKIATLFEGDVKANELQRVQYKPTFAADGMIIYRLQTTQGTYYNKAVMLK